MTPDELGRTLQPGPFAPLRQKLIQLTSPLWRKFRRPRPLVEIRSKLLALPSTPGETLTVETPAVTDEAGLRAWTLSPAQLAALQEQINKLPTDRTLSAPRVSSVSAGWASISAGTTVQVQGKSRLAGVEITARARASKSSWNVTCSLMATEPLVSTNDMVVGLRTNLATACRATVQNGGALVIQSHGRKEMSGTNHWFILSPVAIDAQGKPINR